MTQFSGKEFDMGHIGTFAVNVLRMEKGISYSLEQ